MKNAIKKFALWLCAIAFLLGACGCGEAGNNESSADTSNTDSSVDESSVEDLAWQAKIDKESWEKLNAAQDDDIMENWAFTLEFSYEEEVQYINKAIEEKIGLDPLLFADNGKRYKEERLPQLIKELEAEQGLAEGTLSVNDKVVLDAAYAERTAFNLARTEFNSRRKITEVCIEGFAEEHLADVATDDMHFSGSGLWLWVSVTKEKVIQLAKIKNVTSVFSPSIPDDPDLLYSYDVEE